MKSLLLRERNIGIIRYGPPGSPRNLDGAKPSGVSSCPPIITVARRERFLARLQERRWLPAGRSQRSVYLLSGPLYCGECGARMSGSACWSGWKTYWRYACTARAMGRSRCTGMSYVRAEPLESSVVALLVEHADAEAARAAMPQPQPFRQHEVDEAQATAELTRVADELREQYRLFRAGVIQSEAQLGELNRELQARQEAITQRLQAIRMEREAEERWLQRLHDLPQKARDLVEAFDDAAILVCKAALQELIERVTVWRDQRVEVRFRS